VERQVDDRGVRRSLGSGAAIVSRFNGAPDDGALRSFHRVLHQAFHPVTRVIDRAYRALSLFVRNTGRRA
jgi:hypothetical protein